ncbi:cupin, partial [Xanthomonas sp. Kuri4-3]
MPPDTHAPRLQAIDLLREFALLAEGPPAVVADLNDHQVTLLRMEGGHGWRERRDGDAAYLVLEGELRIDLEQGHLWLRRGELRVMPRGRRFRPFALQARVLLLEPRRAAGRR